MFDILNVKEALTAENAEDAEIFYKISASPAVKKPTKTIIRGLVGAGLSGGQVFLASKSLARAGRLAYQKDPPLPRHAIHF